MRVDEVYHFTFMEVNFMGTYLDPGSSGFEEMLNGDYIDKTGLIALINRRINTPRKMVCISRPRRFGKSYAAKMLCAYYDCTCDSHILFDKYEISKDSTYECNINKYHVIYLDMSNLLEKVRPEMLIQFIKDNVENEILSAGPDIHKGSTFDETLINAVEYTGKKFIAVIDEWDAPIRTAPGILKEYLGFLRMLFKSSGTTPKIFAAAYMTGILPIKKDGSESAVSDFDEFSVLDAGEFAKYTGFTENEVKRLCDEKRMDFLALKKWYDGYSFGSEKSMYNPYSVMKAIDRKRVRSYWRKTSAAEALITYVELGGDELQEKIARLIAGEEVTVYTDDFENDLGSFKSDDDVLTLLIHLGYLSYDEDSSLVKIPNAEVQEEFSRILKKAKNKKLVELVRKSEQLLRDTLAGNEQAVAEGIQRVRDLNYAPMFYNDEQALRYAVKFAYIACMDRYTKIEELPSGRGIADVVYLPNQGERLPALLIELKWSRPADEAIQQIRDKAYSTVLEGYTGMIVCVGITYDEKTKVHSCRIETVTK